MRALAWAEPPDWVMWKVVAVPAGASFQATVKVTPFWVAVAVWAYAAGAVPPAAAAGWAVLVCWSERALCGDGVAGSWVGCGSVLGLGSAGEGVALFGWLVVVFSVSPSVGWVVCAWAVSGVAWVSASAALQGSDIAAIAGIGDDEMRIAAVVMVAVKMFVSFFMATSLIWGGGAVV